MSKRGKVGTGGREIMAALWGSRGRPETNQYAELCADRQREKEDSALSVKTDAKGQKTISYR